MWMKLRKIVNFGPPTLFLRIVPIRVHCFFPASQTFKLHQPSIHQLKFSHSSSESDRQELCKTAPSFMLKPILVLQSRKKSKKIVGPFTANPLGPLETWGYRSARAPHKSRNSKSNWFSKEIYHVHKCCVSYIWEPYECVWKKSIKGVWMFNIQQVIMERPSYKGNSPSGSRLSIA